MEAANCSYIKGYLHTKKIAATYDIQQCGILTSVDSGEPVQPPFKLRNSVHMMFDQ